MPVLPPVGSSGLTSAVYPLALPGFNKQAKIKVVMRNVVGESVSPFTASSQTFEWQAEWLEASIALPAMQQDDARPWAAFFALLRGKSGSFLLGDPSLQAPRGTSAGTPMVNGAGQTGKTLNIKGLPAGAAGVFLSGDWIQLGSGLTQRLYMNCLDVTADGSGNAVLNLFPRLRESPADGELLVSSGAKGIFKLSSNDREFDVDNARIYGFSFSAKEAL